MSDVQNNTQAPTADQAIATLKRQADRIGVSYKANVSVATLQKLIEDKLAENDQANGTSQNDEAKTGEAEVQNTISDYDKAMQLVRVVITPMESTKSANLESESFTAGNSRVGTVTRIIPFGVEWHVERILLNSIKEKRFQMFANRKNKDQQVITTSRTALAYNVAELPPLTEAELLEIAARQERMRTFEDED